MNNRFHIEQGTIYIRWRNKQSDYFNAPLGLVLKYGKKRIQYEININL